MCETVRAAGVPLCLLLSGGYARRERGGATLAGETADLHATVFREARAVFETR